MKKSILLLAALYFTCSSALFAQHAVEGHYGRAGLDVAYAAAATSDGGYIITGLTKSEVDSNGDIVVIKIAAHGDTSWSHTYGGPFLEGGNFVMQLSGGGYMVCGHTQDFGAHDCDAYLMQLDDLGNFQWIKTYGGDSDDVGFSAVPLIGGGYMVGGMTKSYGYGDTGGGVMVHAYFVKTNSTGDSLWTKVYSGTGNEECYSITTIADSEFLAVGYTSSFGAGEEDGWLLRLNTNGDTLWTKLYKTTGSNTQLIKILPTLDGGYIIAGTISPIGATSMYQGIAIKLDASGNQVWQKVYSDSENITFRDVAQLPSGDLMFTGSKFVTTTTGNIYIMTTDVNGNKLSDETCGGTNSYAYAIAVQGNNSYLVAGGAAKYGDPNGDLYYMEMDNTVSANVKNVTAPSARLYPNPIKDQPAIIILPASAAGQDVNFEVMTMEGKVIYSKDNIPAEDIVVNGSNFPAAMYLFRVTCKDGTVYKGKFVVE